MCWRRRRDTYEAMLSPRASRGRLLRGRTHFVATLSFPAHEEDSVQMR